MQMSSDNMRSTLNRAPGELTTLLLWIVQLLFPFTVLGLAIPVVFFTVQNLKQVVFGYYGSESARVFMRVNPRKLLPIKQFEMTWSTTSENGTSPARVAVLLATAGTCILINLAVIALLAKRRSANKFTSDRKRLVPNVPVLVLEAFAFVLALSATCFTRSVARIETIPEADMHRAYKNVIGPAGQHWFYPSAYYDTISWQCAIYSRITMTGYIPGKLCYQGHTALNLVVAITVFEALALGIHTWYFRSARKAPKELEPEDKAPMEDGE